MNKIMDSFGVFDYIEDVGGTYEYTAAEMRAYFAALVGNGVLKGAGNQFNASASGLQVTLGTGIGWLLGARGELTGQVTFTIDPVSSGMSKICSIVLDLDTVNQLIGISVLSGTQAASPSAPQLTTTEQRYQKLLWSATVHDNGTITLADARTYVSRPGDGVSAAEIGAVSFTDVQTLTSAQKARACANAGAEKARLQFTNISVATSAFVSNATYAAFGYRAAIALTGVTAGMTPRVIFGVVEAITGKYAPVAACYDGGVYIYASAVPGAAITIPTIIVLPGV